MSSSTTPQKLWSCSDRDCASGQTSQPRHKTGRKVTSDTFGRNKNPTKAIPDDVWHWQCRSGYQTSKYAAEKAGPEGPGLLYLRHLRQQLVRIKLWRPECTFVVQLSLPAKGRLDRYHTALRQNGGDQAAARAAIAVQPKVGRSEKTLPLSFAEAVSPAHADHIDTHFAGQERPVDFLLDNILTWIEDEFDHGGMVQMPPVEFLINDPGGDETVNNPADNFQAWLDHHAAAAPTSPAGGAMKRRREDDDDDDNDHSEVRPPPKKLPRLKALHGPRPPAPLRAPSRRTTTDAPFGDDTPMPTIVGHTLAEHEAASALLLLCGEAPPPPPPPKRISIASLLNPAPTPPPRAPPAGISKPQIRRKTAPAPLPFWVPPVHQRVVQSIEHD
ncbi:hypothetical protein Slin15195_G069540 [Septoria linicola]|uniref:Uncharacterized protein n=1 Tax=Septoria linicola TaxID=215465 RepID=A0A9Q9AW41_9PEZI|nr:hypothetical protein Slin15195_G069540 [Septoria linicola]